MNTLTVFHSGNPAWATCKKALGVADEMKVKYGSNLEIKILANDSEEARGYNFRSSTNVLLNDVLIPLEVATDRKKMALFLSEHL